MFKWNLLKAYLPAGWLGGRSLACLALLLSTCLVFGLSACEDKDETDLEILIGIEPDHVYLLDKVDEIKPGQTGIASVDALNEKWSVLDITLVFPDVSPDDEAARRYGLGGVLKIVVPANTDIETMLAEYQADPHVAYAEMNKPVEIK